MGKVVWNIIWLSFNQNLNIRSLLVLIALQEAAGKDNDTQYKVKPERHFMPFSEFIALFSN